VNEGIEAVDPALERAKGIVDRAGAREVPVRIVGGLAVRAICPDFEHRKADDQDLDLVSISKRSRELESVLEEAGLVSDAQFNAIHGRRQMRFGDPSDGLHVDVCLDRFVMSHELDIRDRLDRSDYPLDPIDLLLSKLQIHEFNAKDLHDVVHLLSGVPVREGDEPGTLGLDRFGEVVAGDWGWWRTTTGNLERITEGVNGKVEVPEGAEHDPVAQAKRLREFAEEVPKTLGWKMRAKVGERMRWYELPEEVDEA
jgi:hypothetical protein